MKKTLLRFFGTYALLVVIFMLQKPAFLFIYRAMQPDITFADYMAVIWNGLPLDLSMAGYFTIIPGLFYLLALWLYGRMVRPLLKIYFFLVAVLIALIFVADLVLYKYWGFRLDSTPLFYFTSSPTDALASANVWQIMVGLVSVVLLALLLYKLFVITVLRKERDKRPPRDRGRASIVLLVLIGLLFIPIRGGFSVSTMNISKVYYSDVMLFNHAAINPVFSLMESLVREQNLASQYRFMPDDQAQALFTHMQDVPVATDSTVRTAVPMILKKERPNVVFVVLESFLSYAMTNLGGQPNIATHLDRIAEQGILFTRFFSNTFRTDRGLVSIFSGYPAQPTTSIMKYPRKTQSLPSLPKSMKGVGYAVDYYYGGDADFTNMRSYLLAMGVDHLVSDVDFPFSERLSKWGAHDHVLFQRVMNDIEKAPQQEPFLKIIQTSSSHEPFEVPFQKLNEPFPNAIAYTDSCLGAFIDWFKQTGYWDNTLIVLTPDHAARYPESVSDLSFQRYEIPLVLTGGALRDSSMRIDTYASQIDIAATLLYQLGIPHEEFVFSKNILNPYTPHFAYFTFPNAFGYVTPVGRIIYDCNANTLVESEGRDIPTLVDQGKAYLQKLYDDLAAR